MAQTLQLDDNLSNGTTYTFQFDCSNWVTVPTGDVVQADIVANAPDFLTSLQVFIPGGSSSSFFHLTSLYNVQFTYEGDGSDVVSDIANSIIAAVQVGSNDAMTFVGAVAANAASIAVSIPNAVASVEATVNSAVSKTANDAVSSATGAVNTALVGLLPLLLVVVAIILFVLPSLVKSTGTKVSLG